MTTGKSPLTTSSSQELTTLVLRLQELKVNITLSEPAKHSLKETKLPLDKLVEVIWLANSQLVLILTRSQSRTSTRTSTPLNSPPLKSSTNKKFIKITFHRALISPVNHHRSKPLMSLNTPAILRRSRVLAFHSSLATSRQATFLSNRAISSSKSKSSRLWRS